MDSGNLHLLYYRYKDSPFFAGILSLVVIAACILIVVKGIIPQFSEYQEVQGKIKEEKQTILTLQENLAYIEEVRNDELDEYYLTATDALPDEKDYAGILNAISQSAVNAGVLLEDYNFAVGKLKDETQLTDIPSLTINFAISGDVATVKAFLKEISEKFPLAEVKVIKGEGEELKVAVTFYHMSLPKTTYDGKQPINKLTSEKRSLIEKIMPWKNTSSIFEGFTGATESATTQDPFR